MMTKINTIITLLLISKNILCMENCINLQLSISQNIENEGFHRDINWLIETSNLNITKWDSSGCKIALQYDIPSEMFVNPDEISDLNRIGKISAYIKGNVNVETPAHLSENHTIYIYLDNNFQKVLVKLPIHLRYQRAVITGGFGKINLPKPSALVYCSQNNEQLCRYEKLLTAPCDVAAVNECSWYNVSYKALFDEVELFVPIGDLDDYPIVAIVTLLLGCIGSIYILSLLTMAPA